MQALRYCRGTELVVPESVYFPHQNVYIAVVYFLVFWIALIPQLFLLVTQKHLLQHSCYKLMLVVCVLDILNLANIALIPSFLSFFNVHHCNSGSWITNYGHFVLYLWFSYSALNVVLAFNRLLEFVSKDWSYRLFSGFHTWLWLPVVLLYPVPAELAAPNRLYFYDSKDGVWLFRWFDAEGREAPHYFHIFNNIAKMSLIVIVYSLMLALLRRKFGVEAEVSTVQKRLSIQACVIAAACVAGSVAPFIVRFHVIKYFSLNGFVAEIMWMLQHSVPGFVYAVMNRQVRATYRRFAVKIGALNKLFSKASVSVESRLVQP